MVGSGVSSGQASRWLAHSGSVRQKIKAGTKAGIRAGLITAGSEEARGASSSRQRPTPSRTVRDRLRELAPLWVVDEDEPAGFIESRHHHVVPGAGGVRIHPGKRSAAGLSRGAAANLPIAREHERLKVFGAKILFEVRSPDARASSE